MNIKFSKPEYEALLEVIRMADWVIHAHRTEDDPRTKKYQELEQKILSKAAEMGFEKQIVYDKELKKYHPTAEYEEQCDAMKFIDEYDDDTFWDELTERLAFRDLLEQVGEEETKKMEPLERVEKIESLREPYLDEFDEHGITRLKIQS